MEETIMAKKTSEPRKCDVLPQEANRSMSMIQFAILIWIKKMKNIPLEDVWKRLDEISGTLPSLLSTKGEAFIFGTGKKGEAAKMFNEVAEGVALMSFLPGGIHIFEHHWESIHPESDPQTPDETDDEL